MTIGVILGLIGAGLTLLSFLMKDMLRLRSIALISNVIFLAYGILEAQLPSIILNCILIPLNAVRVLELRKILHVLETARRDSPLSVWLLPNMTRRRHKAGELLFSKGDLADEMLYVGDGEVRLVEIDKLLGPGNLIGEMGIFVPDSKRTLTIRCETDCELYSLNRSEVQRLSYSNPELAFYLAHLIIGRVIENKEAAAKSRN